MATRKYELEGPEQLKWSLPQVAELLGYQEGAASIRRLVNESRLPRPRGHGEAQFYSGLDVAIILDMFGRWGPPDAPQAERGRTRQNEPRRGKAGENEEEQET